MAPCRESTGGSARDFQPFRATGCLALSILFNFFGFFFALPFLLPPTGFGRMANETWRMEKEGLQCSPTGTGFGGGQG